MSLIKIDRVQFGRRVRALLADRKMKEKDLALELGMNPTSLGRILRGDQEPTASAVAGIAWLLQASADYLLGIERNRRK